MSLAVLADHMASKGRNGDTMLVHMSPEEVQGLHALALSQGGALTINPETGLPEAFSLKSLLKSVLPMVAGFALGPAGFGIMSSLGAAATVGGITGLATGSLQKGIMAGLGAYGGSELAGALVGGSSAGATAAAGDAVAKLNAAADAGMAFPVTSEAAQQAATKAYADFAAKPFMDQAAGSFTALKNAPGGMFGGLGAIAKPAMMAAAPIMADAMVPTATGMPGAGATPYPFRIRPMAFNQYGQTLEQLPMISATGYQQPPGGASGGIVALAAGGASKPLSPEEFKQMIYEGGADHGVATQRGLDYITSKTNMNPTQATEFWNKALGTKFTEGDYFRVMKEYDKDPYYYEKKFPTTPGPVTGGGVTSGTSTQVGGGQPIVVSPIGKETIPGYKGEDKIYGGDITIPKYVAPDLGTPGKATQTGETIADIRKEYKGTVEMPTLKDFKPTVTGGSKAAYDYLMGQGAYPLNPVIPGGGPIMKPYAESVGMVQPGFYGRQGTFDDAGGFTPTPRVAPGSGGTEQAGGTTGGTTGGTGIVYGPNGAPYANAAAAIAAGVRNYSFNPPFSTTNTSGTGTPITDFLFGTQDASKVPVEDRTINRLPERQVDVSTYDPAAYDYDVGSGDQYTEDEKAMMAGMRRGGLADVAAAGAARGGQFNLGGYSDGGRLLRGPGDGVSDSIPATIGNRQPARLADGEFVIPARIVSEIGNGSTEAGARKLYAMMDRVQRARAKTTGKGKVAKNTRADKYLPA
jgi:hypothetical protein